MIPTLQQHAWRTGLWSHPESILERTPSQSKDETTFTAPDLNTWEISFDDATDYDRALKIKCRFLMLSTYFYYGHGALERRRLPIYAPEGPPSDSESDHENPFPA